MSNAEVMYKVITALVVLLGLYASISKATSPINEALKSLTVELTKATTQLRSLSKVVDDNERSNSESHRRLWNKAEEIEDAVNEHETRISVLESK